MNKNLIILIGRATAPPTVKTTSGGKKYCYFSLATNQNIKQADGNYTQIPDFHNIVAWEYLCDKAVKVVEKGKLIEIMGSVHYRDAEKNGVKFKNTQIRATEILRLDKKDATVPDSEDESVAAESSTADEIPI